MTKIKLVKGDQTAIGMFTAHMNKMLTEITEVLRDNFLSFRKGKCGRNIGRITLRLFDEWLIRNLLPKVNELVALTIAEIKKKKAVEDLKPALVKKLSAFSNVDKYIISVIAGMKRGKSAEECSRDLIWRILETQIENFLVQTSTLTAGRMLMHLVGVDKGAWREFKVQPGSKDPYLKLYWTIRREMSEILPTIYALSELDWLYISDIERQGLERQEVAALGQLEMRLDKTIGTSYNLLKGYDYSFVNMDIWKAVYQDFLSPKEANRLGFVTTPDETVDLILDIANYKEDSDDLCHCKVLDPACGSGTFLVECLARLRAHMQKNVRCHELDRNQPSWKIKKDVLETIVSNINGIDINPFAVFLTTMNLTFQVIDMYSEVRHKYHNFSLSFNVATHDSLAEKPTIQTKLDPHANSRVKVAVERSKLYSNLCDSDFNLVVGNPPWGAVLRGAIGPLGDEKKRKLYKNKYNSSTGKYDYYVLFMERGLKWLAENGVLAMITQVTYVSQAFGDGIKAIIKKNASCEKFVDISTLGSIIFPRHTNYPAITILRKGGTQKRLDLVEVTQL